MYSSLAIKLYAMLKCGIIKSNAMFWREFSKEKVEEFNIDIISAEKELQEKSLNLVCVFDDKFPKIDIGLKKSEKPFLFVFRGDIKLLQSINNNVAVIGVLTPTPDIEKREQIVVKKLVDDKYLIVSGLARGCDTIAHKTCLSSGGKTIAILPTTLDNIYPRENTKLLDEIVNKGGLCITEYATEPHNKFEGIRRFVERDRLQAMFSKSVILVASFRQGEGDSGSRYAMQKAKEYGKKRFVMFNTNSDLNNPVFGLNQDLLTDNVEVLTQRNIKEI